MTNTQLVKRVWIPEREVGHCNTRSGEALERLLRNDARSVNLVCSACKEAQFRHGRLYDSLQDRIGVLALPTFVIANRRDHEAHMLEILSRRDFYLRACRQ